MAFELTDCQAFGLWLLRQRYNVFLSGEAGTGKTFLLNHYIDSCIDRPIVLSSTGTSACLVGGQTFHSFFSLGILTGSQEKILKTALPRAKSRIQSAKEIIIDEVSMMTGFALETAEILCRLVKGNDLPWGGIRMIFVGDFLQLPPITPDEEAVDWAFKSDAWKQADVKPLILKTKVRSKDNELNNILSKIRTGACDQEVIDFLNKRTVTFTKTQMLDFDGTIVFPRKNKVKELNAGKLDLLSTKKSVFPTEYWGLHDYDIENIKKSAPIPEILDLKVGALVMIKVNDSQGKHETGSYSYVNGTTAKVVEIHKNHLELYIEKSGITINLPVKTFSISRWNARRRENEVIASATNFPVILAWAVTAHSCQGATLDKILVNISSLWEWGMTYVILSRVKSADSVFILDWDEDSIIASKKALKFYNKCEELMNAFKSTILFK